MGMPGGHVAHTDVSNSTLPPSYRFCLGVIHVIFWQCLLRPNEKFLLTSWKKKKLNRSWRANWLQAKNWFTSYCLKLGSRRLLFQLYIKSVKILSECNKCKIIKWMLSKYLGKRYEYVLKMFKLIHQHICQNLFTEVDQLTTKTNDLL